MIRLGVILGVALLWVMIPIWPKCIVGDDEGAIVPSDLLSSLYSIYFTTISHAQWRGSLLYHYAVPTLGCFGSMLFANWLYSLYRRYRS